MSAVADPPRRDEATTCPRCDASLAPEQGWCVECGTAARTRIVRPPSWRGPVALVAVLVALVGAGLAMAFVEATDRGSGQLRPATAPVASTPAPAAPAPATPAPTATTPAPGTTTPGATGSATGSGSTAGGSSGSPSGGSTPNGAPATPTGKLQTWPTGVAAYTVLLLSTPDKKTARTTARGLAATGLVGLAHSDDFAGMPPGQWLVFTGTYPNKRQAEAAAAAAKTHGATAAGVQYLKPKR